RRAARGPRRAGARGRRRGRRGRDWDRRTRRARALAARPGTLPPGAHQPAAQRVAGVAGGPAARRARGTRARRAGHRDPRLRPRAARRGPRPDLRPVLHHAHERDRARAAGRAAHRRAARRPHRGGGRTGRRRGVQHPSAGVKGPGRGRGRGRAPPPPWPRQRRGTPAGSRRAVNDEAHGVHESMAHILIVDDEAGIREFLADALEADGHETTTAEDGYAALKLLNERAFDLMITDLRMPGAVDGMDLVRKARSEQPEMEVIVLTAYGTVDTAVEAMKLGAFDYLQKPISSPAELRMVVARALERRRLLALEDRSRRDEAALPPLTYGDPVMAPVVRAIEKVAATDATVLLLGESGTGKELAARTIHLKSPRANGPFVAVNCAAIAEQLMESELF